MVTNILRWCRSMLWDRKWEEKKEPRMSKSSDFTTSSPLNTMNHWRQRRNSGKTQNAWRPPHFKQCSWVTRRNQLEKKRFELSEDHCSLFGFDKFVYSLCHPLNLAGNSLELSAWALWYPSCFQMPLRVCIENTDPCDRPNPEAWPQSTEGIDPNTTTVCAPREEIFFQILQILSAGQLRRFFVLGPCIFCVIAVPRE